MSAPPTATGSRRRLTVHEAFKVRARVWSQRIRVSPRRLQVQAMSRKWASCSTAGTVTFSTDLLQENLDFQDVVIVHELLHLRYRDHGKQFKAMMTALVPNWRELEQRSRHATERADALSVKVELDTP